MQFQVAVKAEEIRRAHGVVGAGNFLRLVDDVGEGEVHPLRQQHHVVPGVFRVIGRVVAHDSDAADAERFQFRSVADDAVEHGLDVGTVIADEHQQQTFWSARRGEAIALAVNAGQIKVDGLPAEVADRGLHAGHECLRWWAVK